MHACKIHSKFTSSTSDITSLFKRVLFATLSISSLYSTFHQTVSYSQQRQTAAAEAEQLTQWRSLMQRLLMQRMSDSCSEGQTAEAEVEQECWELNKNQYMQNLFNIWLFKIFTSSALHHLLSTCILPQSYAIASYLSVHNGSSVMLCMSYLNAHNLWWTSVTTHAFSNMNTSYWDVCGRILKNWC